MQPVNGSIVRGGHADAAGTGWKRKRRARILTNKERTHDQRKSGAKVSIFCGLCGTRRSVRTWTLVGYCLSICPLASIPRSAPSVTETAKPHPFPVPPVASDSLMASQDGRNGRIHFSFLLFCLSDLHPCIYCWRKTALWLLLEIIFIRCFIIYLQS